MTRQESKGAHKQPPTVAGYWSARSSSRLITQLAFLDDPVILGYPYIRKDNALLVGTAK